MIVVDEVEIVNVKGDSVASEETLLALLETMKKMATSKGLDPKEVNKKTKDLANNLDSLVDVVTENTDALVGNTDAKDDNTDAVKRNTSWLGSMAGYIAGSVLTGLTGFTGELITGGTRLQDFSRHIPFIGSLFNGLSGFLDDSIESFRGLSSVGAAFGNSITNMRMNAANMELTLGEMTDLISSNAETLRILGGSVTEGAKRFAQLNKGLKDSGNFRELKEMGFTVQEINEGMLSYIDLQSGLGRLQRMDNMSLQQGTAAYLNDLDKLAKLTGKQREEIASSMSKEMNDARVRAMVSRMTDKQAERFNTNLALISNTVPGIADSFKNLATGLPADEISQALLSIGGDAGNAMAELFANAEDIDPTEFQRKFSELAPKIADHIFSTYDEQQISALMSSAGGGVVSSLLGITGDLERAGNMNVDAVLAEQSQRENITQTLATFDDAVRSVRAEIQKQLLDSGLFKTLADGISSVVNIFTNPQNVESVKNGIQVLADSLDSFMTTFSTEGFQAAIIDSFNDIFNAIKAYVFGASADEQKQQATTKVGELSTRRESLQNREQEISRQIDAIPSGATEQIQQLEAEREAIRTQSNNLASEIGNLETQLKGSFEDIPGVMNGAIASIIPSILGGIGNTLSTGISDLFSGNITTSAMVTAIAGLWAAPKVINAIGGISNLFRSNQGADLDGSSDRRGPTRGSRTAGGRIGSNIGGALGGLTGGILEGVGNGLAAIGAKAPLVAAGAAAVGAAIVAIGAGIAGATWLMGAALPNFAEGMKSFEDVDGAALRDAALGMTAISVAMAAFGVGSAVSGLGNLIGFITNGLVSLFEGEDPMEQLQRFAKYDIDAVKVENNARAMVAFSGALAASGGAQAVSGIGDLIEGITSYLGGIFSNEDPLDKLVRFSKYDIDEDKVIANSNALVAFSKAMTFSAGSQAASGIGDLIDGLLGGLGRLFGAEDPLEKLVRFSKYDINTEKVTQNAEALAAFSNALQNFPEIDSERVGGLFGAIGFIFSGSITMPWDRVNEFGEADINVDKVIANAEALAAFSNALQNFPELDSERVGGLFGAIGRIFSGKITMPWDRVNEFGKAKINVNGVIENSKAISAFSNAFASFPELEIDSERVGGLFGAIGFIFSGKLVMPWDKVNEFGKAKINVNGVIENAKAISAFSNSFANFPELDSERVGGLFASIRSIFSGEIVMPWDRVNEFGNATINADGVTANAKVVSAFSDAFLNFPEIDSERVGGLFASIRSIFSGEIVMPWDRVNEFGNATINADGVTANAKSMAMFSDALQNFPEIDSERVGGLFGAIGRIFSGSTIMPWDKVREFGEVDINVNGVIANASAMRAFGNALSGFSNFETSELDLPDRFTNNLVQISNINGNGLQNIASGLESIVGVTGVRDQLDAINEGLDPAGIRTYTDAIDQLVERLNELNEVLSESNDTLFKDNQSAADVLGNIKVSTQGSSEGISQLNTMLSQMLTVLTQSKEIENKIERNTASLSSDTLSGRVSRMR